MFGHATVGEEILVSSSWIARAASEVKEARKHTDNVKRFFIFLFSKVSNAEIEINQ